MRADDSGKFDSLKKVNFAEATTTSEAGWLLAAKLMFRPTTEAELRNDCASARRDDFVALSVGRGFSGDDDGLVDKAYEAYA